MTEVLKKAREFEETYLPKVDPETLPAFHVTAGIGWINDPNGFSLYKGEYHLFYQYYPYNVKWGPMHWGHVKTKDFIHWEHLPAAMAPDAPFDQDGCFSGSAVELADGRHLLMYTGVRSERTGDGVLDVRQTQCVAVGDGVDYEKYEGNPVIGSELLPEGGSIHDFRDPKIFAKNGRLYAVAGNRDAEGNGRILLYESEDGFSWTYDGVLASSHGQYGRMWECPDLFELDGKDVLVLSPQEMAAVGLEFHPGHGTMCIIGRVDWNIHHLLRERVQAIDYGLDFYAPQTTEAADGRRIMIAWMQNWETTNCMPEGQRFMGQMTIPRELSIENGRLIQRPVRELDACHDVCIDYKNVLISSENSLQGISGRCIDMTVTVRPANGADLYRWFRVNVATDGERFTAIRYKPESSIVRVDRTHSGFHHDIINVREFVADRRNGEIKMRIILDRFSMELFINDGQQAASFVLYTPLSATAISFEVDGMALIDVEKYDLVI